MEEGEGKDGCFTVGSAGEKQLIWRWWPRKEPQRGLWARRVRWLAEKTMVEGTEMETGWPYGQD